MNAPLVFHFRAATEIWTGDAQRRNSRLQLSSLLGGIRWWAEAIVRAHGARACDPTHDSERCKDLATACFVCLLFGSSGLTDQNAGKCAKPAPLACKFALRAWDKDPRTCTQQTIRTSPLTCGKIFYLEFYFRRGRESTEAERYLLTKSLDVIVRYGSIGGRTTLKPALGNNAGQSRHNDYGLLAVETSFKLPNQDAFIAEMKARCARSETNPREWPNLNRFWFAPRKTIFLDHSTQLDDGSPERKTLNGLLGLARMNGPNSKQLHCSYDDGSIHDTFDSLRREARGWPETHKDGRSKKVFSFKNPPRSWGYFTTTYSQQLIEGWLATVRIAPSEIKWGNQLK